MNLLQAAELKVGLLVVSVAGLIAYMSMQVSDDPTAFGKAQKAWFQVADANGIVKGAQVRSAGIPVGVIKNISLQDGEARIDVSLKPDFQLYSSAAVEIRSQGILGDKFVAVNPGSPNDGPLAAGGQILNVKDSGSLDHVVVQIGDIAATLRETAKAVREATTDEGTRKHILGRIISNIEKLTQDLAEVSSQNKGKIGEIVDQVNRVTKSLDDIMNNSGDGSLKAQLQRSMERLDSAMKNIDEITSKVNHGEGTIGKLINDEETVEGLNTAIDGVNSFLDTAGKTQTGLDFHSDYLGDLGLAKTTVGVKLQPGLDRYYYIGIVDDPTGVVESETVKTSYNGGPDNTTDRITTYKNKIKFNVFYAKNFWDFTVRGGLLENSGGLGIDYTFYHDQIKFSVEALEFSNLNLRSQVQWNVWKGVYVLGGFQDILKKQNKYSNYVGAGLLLTNDDLKMLMTKLPMSN